MEVGRTWLKIFNKIYAVNITLNSHKFFRNESASEVELLSNDLSVEIICNALIIVGNKQSGIIIKLQTQIYINFK